MDDSDPQHAKNGSWVSTNEIKHERELREGEIQRLWDAVVNLRESISAHSAVQEKALQLQAKEYERRLEALNHEHARASEALRLTVPRELFDNFRGEYQKDQNETRGKFAKSEGAVDALDRQGRTRGAQLAIGLTIVSIIIGILMRFVQ